MSSDFDPYYLWLGIPPQEQPPNHYRLLGIAAFESNASVIDSAASRQSTYLHSVAAGPQRQASQKLLTEIAGARRALLNAESKLAYDAELRTRLELTAPKVAVPPMARPVGVPVAVPTVPRSRSVPNMCWRAFRNRNRTTPRSLPHPRNPRSSFASHAPLCGSMPRTKVLAIAIRSTRQSLAVMESASSHHHAIKPRGSGTVRPDRRSTP